VLASSAVITMPGITTVRLPNVAPGESADYHSEATATRSVEPGLEHVSLDGTVQEQAGRLRDPRGSGMGHLAQTPSWLGSLCASIVPQGSGQRWASCLRFRVTPLVGEPGPRADGPRPRWRGCALTNAGPGERGTSLRAGEARRHPVGRAGAETDQPRRQHRGRHPGLVPVATACARRMLQPLNWPWGRAMGQSPCLPVAPALAPPQPQAGCTAPRRSTTRPLR
jgi:hypothetical protein